MKGGVRLCSNGAYWQAIWRTTTGVRNVRSLGAKARVSKTEAMRLCREIERTHIINPGMTDATRAPLLSAWRTAYFKQRTDLKDGSVALKGQTFDALIKHFGDVRLDRITRAGAAAFRVMLVGRELSPATVGRYVRDAKSIFNEAKNQDLLPFNPFDRVSGAVPEVSKEWHYVSLDDLSRLMDHLPSTQWRCLIALCRLAGLRRGEALRLRERDVDLVARTLQVWPEEGVEGTKQAYRVVPISPALAAWLREAIDAIPTDEERLCWGLSEPNLNRDVVTYLKRAGLPNYSKAFHTLRKNLESDWFAEHPAPAVCAWLGHSPAVAMRHYHKPTAEMLGKVTGPLSQSATNPSQLPTRTPENH